MTSGVEKVNDILGGLSVSSNMFPNAAASVVQNSSMGTSVGSIVINMDGALIADRMGAMDMAEKMGDAIIKKLNIQLRY